MRVLFLVACIVAACAPCAPADDWRLVFDEDFSKPGWTEQWTFSGRAAADVEGERKALVSGGAETVAKLQKKFNQEALRVEYDARFLRAGAGGFISDLSCMFVPLDPGSPRVEFLVGSQNNAFAFIRFGKTPTLQVKQKVEPGRTYHVVAELNGRAAYLTVDGKRINAVRLPEDPARPFHVWLYSWVGVAEFDNMKIYAKDTPDPVPAGLKTPTRGPKETEQTIAFLRDVPLPPPADKAATVRKRTVQLFLDSPKAKSGLWPVKFGTPFPRDTVWRTGEIRVVNKAGAEAPSQRTVIGTWTKNGSIKWVLVEFFADGSSPPDAYRLEFGSAVKAAPLKPIVTSEDDETITVNTGALKAVISRKRGSILESAWLDADGDGRYARDEQIVRPNQGQEAYFITTRGERWSSHAEDEEYSAVVELAGPIRTVLRARGWYKNAKGERACYFVHRYYFYAGRSDVGLHTTWVCTRDTTDFKFQDLGVRLPLNLDEPIALLGGDKGRSSKADNLDATAAVVQATRHGAWLREGDAKTGLADLDGWLDLSGRRKGLCLSVYDMNEQSPVAIEADREGVTFHAFSGEPGNILGFSVPHLRKLWGEEIWKRFDKGRANLYVPYEQRLSNGCGVAKTHELTLFFHAKEPPADTAERALVVQTPPLVSPDPKWVGATHAVGPTLHYYDPQRFAGVERNIETEWDRLMDTLDRVHPRYDFWDYGMGLPHYTHNTREGPVTYPGYRREYDIGYGKPLVPWYLYLRSGDRRYWTFAVQNVYHYTDWHLQHWTHPRLEKRIGFNTADHGSWPFDQNLAGWTFNFWAEYLPLWYYTTGCERAKDVAIELMDSHYDWVRERGVCVYEGATGIWLGNSALIYRMTWDEKFRKVFKEYERTQLSSWCEYCGYFSIYPGETHPMDKPHEGGHRTIWREYGQDHTARTPGADPRSQQALVGLGMWFLRNTGLSRNSSYAAWKATRDPRFITLAEDRIERDSTESLGFSTAFSLIEALTILPAMQIVVEADRPGAMLPVTVRTPRIDRSPFLLRHEGKDDVEATMSLFPKVVAPDGRNVTVDTVTYDPIAGRYFLRIPKEFPRGIYALSAAVSNTTAWRPLADAQMAIPPTTGVMLDARHGIQISGEYFVRVPKGARQFRVQFRGERLSVFPPDAKPIAVRGLQTIPVPAEADQAVWRLEGKGFVVLCDIPPYVSTAPELAFPLDRGVRAQPLDFGADQVEWTQGAFVKKDPGDKSLHIFGDNKRIRIQLGRPVGANSRERIRVDQGTLEFMIRSDAPPAMAAQPVVPVHISFAKEPGEWLSFEHENRVTMSNGKRREILSDIRRPFVLKEGEWHHVAVVWKLDDGHGKMLRRVWLDGEPAPFETTEPHHNWPPALRDIPQLAEDIVIHSRGHNLMVDELRVSDIPRYGYTDTFPVPHKEFAPDEHTLLLMHFDGNLQPAEQQ